MQCLEKVPSKMNGLIKFNGGFGNNSWMSVQCRHSTNIGMWQWISNSKNQNQWKYSTTTVFSYLKSQMGENSILTLSTCSAASACGIFQQNKKSHIGFRDCCFSLFILTFCWIKWTSSDHGNRVILIGFC